MGLRGALHRDGTFMPRARGSTKSDLKNSPRIRTRMPTTWPFHWESDSEGSGKSGGMVGEISLYRYTPPCHSGAVRCPCRAGLL
jgi:hypothetical protein